MDGDEIGLAEQIVLGGIWDAGLAAFLGGQVLAPGDDLHAKGLRDIRGAGAELAQSENAERHAFEIKADGGLPRCAGTQPRVLVADMPRQFAHPPDRDAGGWIPDRASAEQSDAPRLCR